MQPSKEGARDLRKLKIQRVKSLSDSYWFRGTRSSQVVVIERRSVQATPTCHRWKLTFCWRCYDPCSEGILLIALVPFECLVDVLVLTAKVPYARMRHTRIMATSSFLKKFLIDRRIEEIIVLECYEPLLRMRLHDL